MRPTHLHHVSTTNATALVGPTPGPVPTLVRAAPPSSAYQKAVPSPAPPHDGNGYKDSRDRSDNFVMVRDRKVKVSGSSSLYAACRSWLRNGLSEETQPHYLDGIKLLPKPSPPPVPDAHSPAEQEPNKEEELEEESVEHLSPSDLLQRHVKRAKKIRARLRDERLQRIARYKTRLALLLPPLVEQHQFRNEAGAGN